MTQPVGNQRSDEVSIWGPSLPQSCTLLRNGKLSVPKSTANLYCTCLSINSQYVLVDAEHFCGKFWDN